MKFKNTILDSLKTKFAGIDEKVLDRIARKMATTVKTEEEAKAAVEDLTLQQVIDSYTDSRVTDAQDAAVKNYETKYGLRDGKSIEDPKGTGNGDPKPEPKPDPNGKTDPKPDDVPAYVKEMMAGFKSLNERFDAFEKGRTASSRNAQFEKLIENAPEKMKESYRKTYARMTFKDDDDFKAYLDDVAPEIEEASSVQKGLVGAPKGGGKLSGEQANKYVQERAASRTAETVAPAIQGLPAK